MACSSQIAPYAILMRQAHNPEVAGSNPAPATKKALLSGAFCLQAGAATPILHHRDQRWETFTEEVIKLVCKERSGASSAYGRDRHPQRAAHRSETSRRPSAAHPSEWVQARLPFSGCMHFSRANALLKAQPKRPIHW